MNTKYVELGYPISEDMKVYPGLPEVKIELREDILKNDDWNGSVLSIYLHAGTHVDAPWHYMGGDAPGIDKIPIEKFFYDYPLIIDVPASKPNDLVTVEQLESYGEEIYKADLLIFNTHSYLKRADDFMSYATNFPAISPELAIYIRENLPNVKAVAIDTLSIENISNGKENGFKTHKAFLNPKLKNDTILIYEDINMAPIIDKKLISACCTPLRIVGGDASICNLVVKISDE
ncbi:cyclase family protein [Miniphocaeibacter halophilus]|uniref:Cyclase family protein n=1 Tax=Miniphocaeibacter halophilus TaxID=2931922 RepID=A0AC61MZN9_9FIRM|nr:cyclase family protein [Miniphocaeibacter halophilus]QQK08925.1 cyclase family protein [Miniphocaeibacter halophilus]